MSTGLFIGITQQQNALRLVAIARGAATRKTLFPKSAMSTEAIRIDLNDHEGPVGLAVDEALIDFALARVRGTLATTTLVAPGTEARAEMLARYASHAL